MGPRIGPEDAVTRIKYPVIAPAANLTPGRSARNLASLLTELPRLLIISKKTDNLGSVSIVEKYTSCL